MLGMVMVEVVVLTVTPTLAFTGGSPNRLLLKEHLLGPEVITNRARNGWNLLQTSWRKTMWHRRV